MADDNIALISFHAGFVETGIGEDGLPSYREVVKIIKAVPPYTKVTYDATETDFDEYPGPYQVFQKQQAARKQRPVEGGYPLALWPVVSPAELEMLAARDISTIEQLARSERPNMPGELKELVGRAKHMMELSSKLGKFEALLRDKDSVIEVLNEQVKELQATITAQNSQINNLMLTRAA